MTTSQEFFVQASGSAYTTNTVRGCRASSTRCAQMAAERMGAKLFGASLLRVEKEADENHFTTKWTAHAEEEHWASVQDNGLLDFGLTIPVSNTAVARGPLRELRAQVHAAARINRHDGGGHSFYVPGMSTANSRKENDAALMEWLRLRALGLRRVNSRGIVFETRIRRSALAVA